MLPVLRFFLDGSEHTTHEATAVLAEEFKLSDEERRELLPSGKQGTFHNRIGWAATYLRK